MVAPIDAKAVIEVDGETITLRLNFQSIAMGEELGVDLFSGEGIDFTLTKSALLVKSLSITDHPEITPDQALAIVVKYGGDKISGVVLDLIARFGGKDDDTADKDGDAGAEGNVPKRTRKRKTPAA